LKIEIKNYNLYDTAMGEHFNYPTKSISVKRLTFEGELNEAIELFDRLGITSRNKRIITNENRN
jgi:hypothetical protein